METFREVKMLTRKGWAWLFAITVTLFLLINALVYSGWLSK